MEDIDVARMLLNHGADMKAQDKHRWTPQDYANSATLAKLPHVVQVSNPSLKNKSRRRLY